MYFLGRGSHRRDTLSTEDHYRNSHFIVCVCLFTQYRVTTYSVPKARSQPPRSCDVVFDLLKEKTMSPLTQSAAYPLPIPGRCAGVVFSAGRQVVSADAAFNATEDRQGISASQILRYRELRS